MPSPLGVLWGRFTDFTGMSGRKPGILCKAYAVAVMIGYTTIPLKCNDVTDTHGGAAEILRYLQIELFIQLFQQTLRIVQVSDGAGVNQVIIAAVY